MMASKGFPSQLRYVNYLESALKKINSEGFEPLAALQVTEEEAVKAQKAAVDRKQSVHLTVATPIPSSKSGAGKITLSFGVGALLSPLPNRNLWDQQIQDFTAQDPQVGAPRCNA
jgi:hypothetical protein